MQIASLDAQRELFKQRRFLAMPLAGMLVWIMIGLASPFLSEYAKTNLVWFGCGSIFYLGVLLSKLTGEDFFGKHRAKNSFDGLFFTGIVMSLLVFSIALPFAMLDHTAAPFTVGILAGLMWMPFSWIIQHWIGYFHSIFRTLGILIVYFAFPDARFEAISLVIVLTYAITIYVQEKRFNDIQDASTIQTDALTK